MLERNKSCQFFLRCSTSTFSEVFIINSCLTWCSHGLFCVCRSRTSASGLIHIQERSSSPGNPDNTQPDTRSVKERKKGIKSKCIPDCDMIKEDGRRPGRRRGNRPQREGSGRKTFNKSLNERVSTERHD